MPAPETAERLTVVTCRSWPVVGCGYRPDDVVAVVVANRVVAASAAARRLGVAAGLRRREAQRRAPGLVVATPDPAAEARAFEPVLRALDDLTPATPLWPLGAVLSHLPRILVDDAGRADLSHGRPVRGGTAGTVVLATGQEVVAVACRYGIVEGDPREPRSHELDGRAHEKHEHGDDERQSVRPQVGQQPAHQSGVVGLAEGFFFVVGK